MILSKKEILKAVKAGKIRITPFDERNVGACSVDLKLGVEFKKFIGKKQNIIINPSFTQLDESYWKRLCLCKGEAITIQPKELVLGATLERIKLSNLICAFIDGRSRFARAGLLVHVSSSLVQPGVDNVQVLEIINMSSTPMKLFPGTKICQIVFHELKGAAEYAGLFKMQSRP
jgi:dCTP deaminase